MLPKYVKRHVAVSTRCWIVAAKQSPSFGGLSYRHNVRTRAQLQKFRLHSLNSKIKFDVVVTIHGSAHSHYLFTNYYEHIPSVCTEHYFRLHWIATLIVDILLDDPHPSFGIVFYFGLELDDPQANVASLLQNEIEFASVVSRFGLSFNLHGSGYNSAAIIFKIPHYINISIFVL